MDPKQYSKQEAKRLMKQYGLKWTWNKVLKEGDIKCFCGKYFTEPDRHGFVITYALYENIDITKFVSDPKFPNGRPIYRVPNEWPTKWWIRTYFNKEEYEDYIKDKVSVTGRHPTFEEIWENNNYPKTNEEAKEMIGKYVGHTYRSILALEPVLYGYTKEIVGENEFHKDILKKHDLYEKVISLGLYDTPNPNLLECPICDIVNSICYYNTNIPLWYKIKERYFRRRLYHER